MNILAIATCYGLFQPKSGGRNRFYNLVKPLKKQNKLYVIQPLLYQVEDDKSFTDVYYFRSNILGRTFNILTDFNPSFILKLHNVIKNEKIDIIQISHPYGVFLARFLIKLMKKDVKLVLDAHNVEKEIADTVDIQKIDFKEKLFAFVYIHYVPFIEKLALRNVDYVLAVSDEDRRRFIINYKVKPDKVMVIPSAIEIKNNEEKMGSLDDGKQLDLLDDEMKLNSVNVKEQGSLNKKEKISQPLNEKIDLDQLKGIKKSGKNIIIFHGSYFHPPNRKAIDLIRSYIAPKIPEAIFLLAGNDTPIFEEENVKSVGFVNDLYSFIRVADIAIVPLLSGGGTRLKILDYMMMGLPIVTTRKGIEGIKAVNKENALIFDDVREGFINSIKELINNRNKRETMGQNNRKLIEAEYSNELIGDKLNDFYWEIGKK